MGNKKRKKNGFEHDFKAVVKFPNSLYSVRHIKTLPSNNSFLFAIGRFYHFIAWTHFVKIP